MNIMYSMKVARVQACLTQKELAEYAGLSEVAVNHIEKGITKPRKSTQKKIETVLAQKIDWDLTEQQGRIKRKRKHTNNKV